MKRLLNTLYVTNPDAYLRKQDDAIAVYLDDTKVMFLRDLADQLHLVQSQDTSGRVARADAADRFGILCNGSFDQFTVSPCIAVFRLRGDRDELAVDLVAECVVVRVERLSDDSYSFTPPDSA